MSLKEETPNISTANSLTSSNEDMGSIGSPIEKSRIKYEMHSYFEKNLHQLMMDVMMNVSRIEVSLLSKNQVENIRSTSKGLASAYKSLKASLQGKEDPNLMTGNLQKLEQEVANMLETVSATSISAAAFVGFQSLLQKVKKAILEIRSFSTSSEEHQLQQHKLIQKTMQLREAKTPPRTVSPAPSSDKEKGGPLTPSASTESPTGSSSSSPSGSPKPSLMRSASTKGSDDANGTFRGAHHRRMTITGSPTKIVEMMNKKNEEKPKAPGWNFSLSPRSRKKKEAESKSESMPRDIRESLGIVGTPTVPMGAPLVQSSSSENLGACRTLFDAAKLGDVEQAKLLRGKLGINGVDSNGQSALHHAAINNKLIMVQYLIQENIQTNIQDRSGMTALDWACMNGHKEIANYLILEGAKFDVHSKPALNIINKSPLPKSFWDELLGRDVVLPATRANLTSPPQVRAKSPVPDISPKFPTNFPTFNLKKLETLPQLEPSSPPPVPITPAPTLTTIEIPAVLQEISKKLSDQVENFQLETDEISPENYPQNSSLGRKSNQREIPLEFQQGILKNSTLRESQSTPVNSHVTFDFQVEDSGNKKDRRRSIAETRKVFENVPIAPRVQVERPSSRDGNRPATPPASKPPTAVPAVSAIENPAPQLELSSQNKAQLLQIFEEFSDALLKITGPLSSPSFGRERIEDVNQPLKDLGTKLKEIMFNLKGTGTAGKPLHESVVDLVKVIKEQVEREDEEFNLNEVLAAFKWVVTKFHQLFNLIEECPSVEDTMMPIVQKYLLSMKELLKKEQATVTVRVVAMDLVKMIRGALKMRIQDENSGMEMIECCHSVATKTSHIMQSIHQLKDAPALTKNAMDQVRLLMQFIKTSPNPSQSSQAPDISLKQTIQQLNHLISPEISKNLPSNLRPVCTHIFNLEKEIPRMVNANSPLRILDACQKMSTILSNCHFQLEIILKNSWHFDVSRELWREMTQLFHFCSIFFKLNVQHEILRIVTTPAAFNLNVRINLEDVRHAVRTIALAFTLLFQVVSVLNQELMGIPQEKQVQPLHSNPDVSLLSQLEENLQKLGLALISTANVKLFQFQDEKWSDTAVEGILGFIKQQQTGELAFNIFDTKTLRSLRNFQVEDGLEYVESSYYFHRFRGSNGKFFAFSFYDAEEAKEFSQNVRQLVN